MNQIRTTTQSSSYAQAYFPARRICLVIPHMEGGGAQRVMALMANYWAQAGWGVTLLSLVDDSKPSAYPLDPNVVYKALGISDRQSNPICDPRNMGRILQLRNAIRKDDPDAVISFIEKANVASLIACFGLGVPVIVSERIDPVSHYTGLIWNRLRELTYRAADRIVVQTSRAAEGLPQSLRRRIRVIPNPVAVSPIQKDLSRKKAILSMGRLERQKGFDILLRSFASLKDKHSDWTLTILGEGPLRNDLTELAASLGIAERVEMPGWVDKPHRILSQGQVFVMSSRYEGFPNALLEAIACGLAVISSDCRTGPREIIQHGHDGLLVPPEDPEALAAAMDHLMTDDEYRRRLASNAKNVLHRFTLGKIMQLWEDLLRQVIHPDTVHT